MNEPEEHITLAVGWQGGIPESDLEDDLQGQAADAEWFATPPERPIYERPPIGRELLFTTPPGHVLASIIVLNLPSGARIRKPRFRRIERREVN